MDVTNLVNHVKKKLEKFVAADTIVEGTIVNIFDKGAIIALQYGVEGFANLRALVKEDGSQCKVDEKLPFKVIEFSKAAKRIILSHTKVWEDAKNPEKEKKANTGKGKKEKEEQPKIEKATTTLGDLFGDALKSQMEQQANKSESAE